MLKDHLIDVDETSIQETYQLPKLASKLIAASNLSEEQIQDLIHGSSVSEGSDAECLKQAAQMILDAKEKGEKIFIAGDYDCDGICGTSILKETLDRLQIENGYYIPDRFKEGYGLSKETVEKAIAKGYTLFLTVDNGVKCFDAIETIHACGAKVIVTDHHQIEEEVLSDVLVHPTLLEEEYSTLCGAGVALQLSKMLIGDCLKLTSLAAIASIGDVMPLWKQTRCIVKEGFEGIRQGVLPSVTSLIYKGSPIDVETIGFQVVPKINAVGRMSDRVNANTLIPFLLSEDLALIENYTRQLNQVNNLRKSLSTKMCEKAEGMLDENDTAFLIADEDFHQGLCGLVAGRIANQYGKPTVVLSKSDGLYKGSGRSVEGFNLFEFFANDFEEFEAFGGHEFAVGMSIKEENFPSFQKTFEEKLKGVKIQEKEEGNRGVLISSNDVNFDEITGLNMLEPYPSEMVEPIFGIVNPEMTAFYQLPKVTRYQFRNEALGFDGVLFPWKKVEPIEHPSCILGKLSINRWKNQVKCQMMLEDVE